jgi:hypothetical protein
MRFEYHSGRLTTRNDLLETSHVEQPALCKDGAESVMYLGTVFSGEIDQLLNGGN